MPVVFQYNVITMDISLKAALFNLVPGTASIKNLYPITLVEATYLLITGSCTLRTLRLVDTLTLPNCCFVSFPDLDLIWIGIRLRIRL